MKTLILSLFVVLAACGRVEKCEQSAIDDIGTACDVKDGCSEGLSCEPLYPDRPSWGYTCQAVCER